MREAIEEDTFDDFASAFRARYATATADRSSPVASRRSPVAGRQSPVASRQSPVASRHDAYLVAVARCSLGRSQAWAKAGNTSANAITTCQLAIGHGFGFGFGTAALASTVQRRE